MIFLGLKWWYSELLSLQRKAEPSFQACVASFPINDKSVRMNAVRTESKSLAGTEQGSPLPPVLYPAAFLEVCYEKQ